MIQYVNDRRQKLRHAKQNLWLVSMTNEPRSAVANNMAFSGHRLKHTNHYRLVTPAWRPQPCSIASGLCNWKKTTNEN